MPDWPPSRQNTKGWAMLRSGQLPRCIVLVLSFLMIAGRAAVAQTTTGKIEGVVRDTSGDPIPGVTVEATSPSLPGLAHGHRRVADGAYRFPAIASRHVPRSRDAVRLSRREKTATVSLDATATVDLTLQLIAEEQVVVSGEAPLIDFDLDDDRYELHERRHRAPAGSPQLRRHRASRIPASRPTAGYDAGTLARADDLRRDLRREPVDHRRRQHDQRPQGGPGQGHQQRVRAGGRGQDRRLPGRVRPRARGRRQRHHQVGRQRVSRRRVRLLRLDGHRGRAAVRARRLGHRADAGRRRRAVRLRRGPRRVPRQGSALVLRRVQPRQSPGPPVPGRVLHVRTEYGQVPVRLGGATSTRES